MKFELEPDANSQWRWRLIADNNRIIASSGEGYHNEADCRHAIDLVKGSANAPVVKITRYELAKAFQKSGFAPFVTLGVNSVPRNRLAEALANVERKPQR